MPRYTKQTWTDGVSALSAARMLVLENGIFDSDYSDAVRAYHNANQSLTTATLTAIALNSERFDESSNAASTMHDLVTNNSRLTCRVAGIYKITGCLEFAANATGTRDARIRHQGTTYIGFEREPTNTASYSTILTVTCDYKLAVNEYVELVGYQDSGAGLNVVASANYSPEFSMVRVG